jgi:thymidylate kinase
VSVGTRSGFTVALIGPDGAGKTTVARELETLLAGSVTYLYMGVNPDASNHLLPTTRIVHAVRRQRGGNSDAADTPTPRNHRASGRPALRKALRTGRSFLRLGNRLAEEWHRALLASLHRRRGSIVVFDRHFFADYYAYDVRAAARRSAARRLHGFVLSRLYPRPDLVIYLDAPADVLFARKGEGTLESLEQRRREYLELGKILPRFVVIDASRPLETVVEEVVHAISAFSPERPNIEEFMRTGT